MEKINPNSASGEAVLTDATVACRVLAGETSLYELLMRRHNQKLYRAIRSYLKQEQDVEDAMQETYLKGFEKLSFFRHEAQFSTWLIRIGINTAMAKLREHQRIFPFSLLAHQPEDDSQLLNQINYLSPEHIVLRQEANQLLEKAIDKIPEKYRIIYTLREIEGMPVSEIAQCLDLSESNVKVRLHRAKAILKEHLLTLSEPREIFEFGNERCDALVNRVLKALPCDRKV